MKWTQIRVTNQKTKSILPNLSQKISEAKQAKTWSEPLWETTWEYRVLKDILFKHS